MITLADADVVSLRLENLEDTVTRHERLIEQLVQSQIDMKTGLTRVATELEITNGLLGNYKYAKSYFCVNSNCSRCYGSFNADVIV